MLFGITTVVICRDGASLSRPDALFSRKTVRSGDPARNSAIGTPVCHCVSSVLPGGAWLRYWWRPWFCRIGLPNSLTLKK